MPIYEYDFHKSFSPFRLDGIDNNFLVGPENILLKIKFYPKMLLKFSLRNI